jgi:hypothetical protein
LRTFQTDRVINSSGMDPLVGEKTVTGRTNGDHPFTTSRIHDYDRILIVWICVPVRRFSPVP